MYASRRGDCPGLPFVDRPVGPSSDTLGLGDTTIQTYLSPKSWKLGDIALFDNRSTQHYAMRDYDTTRVMQKSILAGDRPYGAN